MQLYLDNMTARTHSDYGGPPQRLSEWREAFVVAEAIQRKLHNHPQSQADNVESFFLSQFSLLSWDQAELYYY